MVGLPQAPAGDSRLDDESRPALSPCHIADHVVGEPQNKKNYNYLCKCIANVEARYTKIVEEVG